MSSLPADVLGMPGVVEAIYGFLDPVSQRSLSRTSKHFRAAYLRTFYPRGIGYRQIGISTVDLEGAWCKAGGCGKKSTGLAAFLEAGGVVQYAPVCRANKCRMAFQDASAETAVVELLRIDNMQGRYLPVRAAASFANRFSTYFQRMPTYRSTIYSEFLRDVMQFGLVDGKKGGDADVEDIIEICATRPKAHMMLDCPNFVVFSRTVFVITE